MILEQLTQRLNKIEKMLADTFKIDINKLTIKEIIDLEIKRSFLRGEIAELFVIIEILKKEEKNDNQTMIKQYIDFLIKGQQNNINKAKLTDETLSCYQVIDYLDFVKQFIEMPTIDKLCLLEKPHILEKRRNNGK